MSFLLCRTLIPKQFLFCFNVFCSLGVFVYSLFSEWSVVWLFFLFLRFSSTNRLFSHFARSNPVIVWLFVHIVHTERQRPTHNKYYSLRLLLEMNEKTARKSNTHSLTHNAAAAAASAMEIKICMCGKVIRFSKFIPWGLLNFSNENI